METAFRPKDGMASTQLIPGPRLVRPEQVKIIAGSDHIFELKINNEILII